MLEAQRWAKCSPGARSSGGLLGTTLETAAQDSEQGAPWGADRGGDLASIQSGRSPREWVPCSLAGDQTLGHRVHAVNSASSLPSCWLPGCCEQHCCRDRCLTFGVTDLRGTLLYWCQYVCTGACPFKNNFHHFMVIFWLGMTWALRPQGGSHFGIR